MNCPCCNTPMELYGDCYSEWICDSCRFKFRETYTPTQEEVITHLKKEGMEFLRDKFRIINSAMAFAENVIRFPDDDARR